VECWGYSYEWGGWSLSDVVLLPIQVTEPAWDPGPPVPQLLLSLDLMDKRHPGAFSGV
jgi:hypothetical protein